MKRVIATIVVLVLAVSGGLWWQQSRSDDPKVLPDRAAPAIPSPSAGYRLVGRGGAVVEVPKSFGTDKAKCGTPLADTVIFYSQVTLLCLIKDEGFSTVLIAPYDVGASFDATNVVKTFSSKADDAFIVVSSKDKAVFDHIVKSFRHLPAGSTTVPELFNGISGGRSGVDALPTRAEITKRLERFGLKATFAKLNSVRGKARSYSTPTAGSVVPVGSTVVVALN